MASDILLEWTNVDDVAVQLTDMLSTRVTLTKEIKTNALEVVFPAKSYIVDNDVIFVKGETLAVYAVNSGILDSANLNNDELIGTFIITDVQISLADKTIKIKCVDLTYSLLGNLFSRAVKDTALRTSASLVNIIVQESDENGLVQDAVLTNIASTNSNGDPFPVFEYYSAWKTGYDAIGEISQQAYTGDDRDYIFWLDPDGTFNWIYPTDEIEALVLDSVTSPLLTMTQALKESENISMLIIDCGKDLNGSNIYERHITNNVSGVFKYYPLPRIADELKVLGTITDNAEFRTEAKKHGLAWGKSIINLNNSGVHTTTVEIKGQRVNMAKLFTVKSEMFPTLNLRLQRVVHTFEKNGWRSRLELEEDVN